MTEQAALPPEWQKVLGWISDPTVAIEDFPAVLWWDGDRWWSGVPGKYINLTELEWIVSRWDALPAHGEKAGGEKN